MRDLDPRLLSAERDVLRQMCKTESRALFCRIEEALKDYSWRSADHEVVFEALRRLARTKRASSPSLLHEEVTRMGFPDIDVAAYFPPACSQQTPHNENESQEVVARLLAQLKSAMDPQ